MSDPRRILVVDDEANIRRVLAAVLSRDGYEVVEAADGEQALGLIGHGVAAIITDLRMPRVDGMALLRRVVAEHPDIPVVMITAHGSVDSAVEAVKVGAFDYLEKPFDTQQIRQIVAKAIKSFEADQRSPRRALAVAPAGRPGGRFGLIGDSTALKNVFQVIEKVADTPSTVLVTGESGTGKELVARALHENSSRRDQPFIKINCGAIPKDLMEPELFGYEKGAFTSAVSSKPGRFELAHGGTLFLDEIGEIPVDMQVKLLRVLQEAEFERVGGIKTIKVDVRLIAATNRDLQQRVAEKQFREDLFYRLNVVPIPLPPLRERRDDIPLLVRHFIVRFNERLKKQIADADAGAMERLVSHAWPGNIRELENVIERTMLFCAGPIIHVGDLPPELQSVVPAPGATSIAQSAHAAHAGHAGLSAAGEAAAQPVSSLKDIVRKETERVERELIIRALEETGGNVSQSARNLKISRKSLQNKMKEFGLRDREKPE